MQASNPVISSEKKTLLIVEDSKMNREILKELLSDDFNILLAHNGLVGLDLMEEHKKSISIVLLDIFMPECTGFDFLERKQTMRGCQTIPVIVMTASNTVEDEIRCLELGASDFISKPYNTEVMKNRIRSIINLRETSSMLNRIEKDRLTGLYSKEVFLHKVSNILQTTQDSYDLICSDIVNFRRMSERYGENKSDLFLRNLAQSLMKGIPDILLGGRISTDIFCFLLRHQDGDWAEATLKNVLGKDHPASFIIKYGLVPNVDHALPPKTLTNHATCAIKNIKGRFDATVGIYDEEFHKEQQRIAYIEEGMLEGLKNREFKVYYQPKHSATEDVIVAAEALVRWQHPKLGFIGPNIFIPLFERNGFITQLDLYVWEEVCREIRHCIEVGFSIVPISVNLSRLDFDIPNLAEKIIALVDKYEIDHSFFHVEVTESMCTDNVEQIAETCKKLHDAGFLIELDDFGSGFTALSYLSQLNVDILKLDVSLMQNAKETRNYSLVRYAILLAESMKMKTVAEGVEVEEQAAALRVLGCDYIQGYYYSKPLPQEEFEPYLLEYESSKGEDYFNRIF
ncbi:MAG: EAL domain-containing protein [Desulfovibrio sp.]|nr:EAL domain-containing protein [Desulfovibrio sp.]